MNVVSSVLVTTGLDRCRRPEAGHTPRDFLTTKVWWRRCMAFQIS